MIARSIQNRTVVLLSQKWLLPVTLLMVASVYYCLRYSISSDMRSFLMPWYDRLLTQGRWSQLGGNFYDYSPPYIYLLSIASLFDGLLSKLILIKLVSVAGTAAMAVSAYWVLVYFIDRLIAANLAAATMLIPTVGVNCAYWGQCDAIYAAPVIGALALGLRQKWVWMLVLLGIALSFKLQTIFIAPLGFALLLAGRFKLWMIPIPLVVFAAMLVPSWLAGRPFIEAATVYVHQTEVYPSLTLAAPNIWQPISRLDLVDFQTGSHIGIALAVAAVLIIGIVAWRRSLLTGIGFLLTALLSVIIVPYVLPMMHERYFFMADVLSMIIFGVRPRWWSGIMAACVQIGSAVSMMSYLSSIRIAPLYGFVFMTIALIICAVAWWKRGFATLSSKATKPPLS